MTGIDRSFRSILREAWLHFFRDRCLDRAAVVAFYSLVSMGPLLYLISSFLSWMFFGGSSQPGEPTLARLRFFLPAELAEALSDVGSNLRFRRTYVWIAAPALIWISSTVFTKLEQAINGAFKTGGSFVRSRLKAFAVLGLGGCTLAASIVIQAIRSRWELPAPTETAGEWLSYAGLLLISLLAFLFFFKLLPRGRVFWPAALAGALVSVTLWEVARHVFATLLFRSPGFGLLDGALAAIVALMLWVYVAVAVTLFGAEVAAVINTELQENRRES